MKHFLLEDQRGHQFSIDKEFVTLGRSEKNRIIVKDPAISRHHLNFYIQNNQLIVEDAGSQNGFLVNGQFPGKNSPLQHGDELSFGQNVYRVWEKDNPSRTKKPSKPEQQFTGGPQVDLYNHGVVVPGGQTNRRIIIYSTVAILIILMALNQNKTAQESSDQDNSKDDALVALPIEGFQKNPPRIQGPTEVLASSRFREALRDYYQGNYSRAIVGLQDSLALDPSNEDSKSFLNRAEILLKNQLDDLLVESSNLYQGLHYKKSKSLALEVLTILSEQTPGYIRKLAQENEQLALKNNNLSHEDIMLRTKCSGMQHEKHCLKALDLLSRCRRHLGEENLLK